MAHFQADQLKEFMLQNNVNISVVKKVKMPLQYYHSKILTKEELLCTKFSQGSTGSFSARRKILLAFFHMGGGAEGRPPKAVCSPSET